MAKRKIYLERELTPEEQEKRDREEEVRANARRIARQILDIARNGLFVSLRFMDVALCQFDYVTTDQLAEGIVPVKSIATTGQHMVYNPQYVIEQYMRDRQRLSRDYLHIVLHCIFRHPFVSENLNQENWDLACDIAVEGIISELDVRQANTRDADRITEEIAKIRGKVKQLTAEHLYAYLNAGKASQKDLELWTTLFHRDEHDIWWEIARQIAEEMKRRAEEEKETGESDDAPEPGQADEETDNDDENDQGEESEDEDSETDDEDMEDAKEPGEDSEDSEEGEDSEEDKEDEESEDKASEEGSKPGEDSEEDDQEEDDHDEESDQYADSEADEGGEGEGEGQGEDEYSDEYSSTPGQSMQRENENDIPDPDSDTHDTGKEDGGGSGGGNPGDDPEQTDEEGTERKNDQSTDDLSGRDDKGRKQDESQPKGDMQGQTEEGQLDVSGNDPQDEKQHKNDSSSSMSSKGGKAQTNTQEGTHNAGTGGGGDGQQSAWQHDSGGANRRGDGEKDGSRNQLDGDPDKNAPVDEYRDDNVKKQEAKATEASNTDSNDEDKAPSLMHTGEQQKELADKWKDISERMMIDLETSSKEWGDQSDGMMQSLHKINKDKYDYSTFLRKFSTLKEDIQLNDDEFDYVYYTLGMERYGNIPLIEPLEYKEVRKVRDFVIAIDTSGSCAGEVVQKFLDKTYSLFAQQENFFRKINLHIIQCDAEIQSDAKITSKQEFDDYMKNLEFKGFGGTDFRPVFEYVNIMVENGEFDDLKGLIYFTDGNGTYPKKRPPYDTAFIFVDDDEFDYQVPSWAMKLVLETSDITEDVLI